MLFTSVVSVLALPVFVAAQVYGPPPGSGGNGGGSSSSSTSSSAAAAPTAPADTTGFVNVDVAFNETFTFHPANFTASNGTIVTFFFPNAGLDHTVTQSSFAEPCTPLAANSTTGAPAGFDSQFQADVQFSINITNDQIPIWFHCKMPQHCGMGMVGSINAPTTGNNTFEAFQAAAIAIGAAEPVESTGSVVLSGNGAVATVAPSNTAGASGSSSSSGSSSGASRFATTSAATALLGAAAAMIFFA